MSANKGIGGSLPPGVVGQLCGYIEVNLDRLNWLTSKPIHSAVIRLNWKKLSRKTVCVYQRSNSQDVSLKLRQVRYAVRCQIESLNTYLQYVLSAKLLTNKSGLILGRGKILNIHTLVPNGFVKSSFFIINEENENVAEVALELKLTMKDSTQQDDTLKNMKPVRQVSFANQVQIKKPPKDKLDSLLNNISNDEPNVSDVVKEEVFDKNASEQLLSTLQSKVLLLKTELSKLIYQNKLSQNSTGILNENKFLDALYLTNSVLEENELLPYNLNNIEPDTVDLLLSEDLSFRDKRVLSIFNDFKSSDEDEDYLSDIDDPLHNDEIVNQLFFKSEKIEVNTVNTRINSTKTNFAKDCKTKPNISGRSHAKSQSQLPTSKFCKSNQPKKSILRNTELPAEHVIKKEKDLKPILLHFMLHISSGFNFVPPNPRNLYLVCKTILSDQDCRSEVFWDCTNPNFNFQQIIPVKINNDLLNRLKNNFMVVEVWEKKNLNAADQLFGICKLPVHTFYLSFREDEINNSLIKLKEPVIAVDGNLPIMNLSQTAKLGDLKVLLALGTRSQIKYQQVSSDKMNNNEFQKTELKINTSQCEYYVSHIFSLNSFTVYLQNPPGSLIWGESNCFIEYVFPKIIQNTHDEEVLLCYFKLKHRLCEPVIYFEDSVSHTIRLPNNIFLRDTLKNIFENGELPIYIYCRYYYPNEFDRLVAKTYLTVEELLSVCTSTSKIISLKLTSCKNPTAKIKCETQGKFIGELKLKISYEELQDTDKFETTNQSNIKVTPKLPLNSKVCENELSNEISPFITLMISVERACNLPLISSYVKTRIPPNTCVSLSKSHERITNIFQKSTEPVWNWRGAVSILPSKLQLNNQVLSLNVWHVEDKKNDFLLGMVSIDLMPLFLKSQLINAWYDITDFRGLYQGKIKMQIELANIDVAQNYSWFSVKECTTSSSNVHKLDNNSTLTVHPDHSSVIPASIDNNSSAVTRSFLLEKLNNDLEELSELQRNLKPSLIPEINFGKQAGDTFSEVSQPQNDENSCTGNINPPASSLSTVSKSNHKPIRIAAAIFR